MCVSCGYFLPAARVILIVKHFRRLPTADSICFVVFAIIFFYCCDVNNLAYINNNKNQATELQKGKTRFISKTICATLTLTATSVFRGKVGGGVPVVFVMVVRRGRFSIFVFLVLHLILLLTLVSHGYIFHLHFKIQFPFNFFVWAKLHFSQRSVVVFIWLAKLRVSSRYFSMYLSATHVCSKWRTKTN